MDHPYTNTYKDAAIAVGLEGSMVDIDQKQLKTRRSLSKMVIEPDDMVGPEGLITLGEWRLGYRFLSSSHNVTVQPY